MKCIINITTILLFIFISGCSNKGKHPRYIFKRFGIASDKGYERRNLLRKEGVDTLIYLLDGFDAGFKSYSAIIYKRYGTGFVEIFYDAPREFNSNAGKRTRLRGKYNENIRVFSVSKQNFYLDSIINYINLNLDSLNKPKHIIPDLPHGLSTYYKVYFKNDSFSCQYYENYLDNYPNSSQRSFSKYILKEIKRQVNWY